MNNNEYEYWKKYRKELTNIINKPEEIIEKTPKNIYEMAKNTGVKATGRYFNIDPSSVRYHIRKYEEKLNQEKY